MPWTPPLWQSSPQGGLQGRAQLLTGSYGPAFGAGGHWFCMQCHLWPAAGSHGSAPWPGPRTGAVGVLSAPPQGGCRHGTVVRGGAVEAGLSPRVGQLAARSAAYWVLFRLLCCGGSAGAAQVVCVCPGCHGRESAGGLSQALAAGQDLGARGDRGFARVDPGGRFVRGNFISCKPAHQPRSVSWFPHKKKNTRP